MRGAYRARLRYGPRVIDPEHDDNSPRGSRVAFLLTIIMVIAALARVGGAYLMTPR